MGIVTVGKGWMQAGTDDRQVGPERAERQVRDALDAAFSVAATGEPKRWFVAASRDENRSADELRKRGVTVWQPRYRKGVNRSRGREARVVERPLFPGYLFVRLPECAEAFHAVSTIASGLLGATSGTGVWPVSVADDVVNGLMAACEAKIFDDTTPRRRARLEALLAKGEWVKIGAGAFAGLMARVADGWKGGHSVRLEAQLFGGLSVITVPVDDVHPIPNGDQPNWGRRGPHKRSDMSP